MVSFGLALSSLFLVGLVDGQTSPTCSASVDGVTYDISPLDGAFKEILEVVYTNNDAMFFRINPCTPITRKNIMCSANCCYRVGPASLLGTGDSIKGGMSPARKSKNQDEIEEGGDVLASYGQWFNCGDKLQWEPLTSGEGVVQRYTGGTQSLLCSVPTSSVEMSIDFVCDYGAGLGTPTTATDFEKEARKCSYKFLWKTSVVCPNRISKGWIFNIIVLCLAIVYFVGGTVYNIKKGGMEGAEAIPHRNFWVFELPSLVREGVSYFQVLCVNLKNKVMKKNEYQSMEDPEQIPT